RAQGGRPDLPDGSARERQAGRAGSAAQERDERGPPRRVREGLPARPRSLEQDPAEGRREGNDTAPAASPVPPQRGALRGTVLRSGWQADLRSGVQGPRRRMAPDRGGPRVREVAHAPRGGARANGVVGGGAGEGRQRDAGRVRIRPASRRLTLAARYKWCGVRFDLPVGGGAARRWGGASVVPWMLLN